MPGAIIPPPLPPGTPWVCRRIFMPDDPLWFALVMGALKQLTFRYYWDSTTGDVDAVTELARDLYYRYQDGEGCDVPFDCSELVACLTNPSEALLAALASAATAAGITPDAQGAEAANKAAGSRPVTVAPDDCHERNYAAIAALVDRLDNDVRDFLEQVEVQTNISEFAAALLGMTGATAGVISEFVVRVQDNLFELYEAQWTDELRDVIVCDLWCEFGASCEGYTLAEIALWYAQRATVTLDEDFWPLMAALASGTLPSSTGYVYGLQGLALAIAVWGATPINTPVGAWTPDPAAANRYLSLLEYAALSPVPVPAACDCPAPPSSGAVYIRTGGTYRINGVLYTGSTEPIEILVGVGDVIQLNSDSATNPYYFSGNPRLHSIMGLWVNDENSTFQCSVDATANIWFVIVGATYAEDGDTAYANSSTDYAWLGAPWNTPGATSITITITALNIVPPP